MYWLRRIPAETRIVVLVVFLALFQAILLSVFGLGAIRGERRQAREDLTASARTFLQQYLAPRCGNDMRDLAHAVFGAAFDLGDGRWAEREPLPGKGLFVEAFRIHADGGVLTPDGRPLLPTARADPGETERARQRARRVATDYRTGLVDEADKPAGDLEFARDNPFLLAEDGSSLALLFASTPLLLSQEPPDAKTLLSMRWLGILNQVSHVAPRDEVDAFLARIDARGVGDAAYAEGRVAHDRRQRLLEALAVERPYFAAKGPPRLHRNVMADRGLRFYVWPVGGEGNLRVLAVDPPRLGEFLAGVVAGARRHSQEGIEPRIVEGDPSHLPAPSIAIEAMPGYAATARILRGAVRKQAKDSERFYWYIIAFSVAGILAGGFLTARVVMREIKLAKLKSGFVSNVTHELKTPLTSIRMFAEMLRSGKITDAAERAECLDVMAQETDRLGKLIQQVLDFGRLDARKRRFRWVTGPLAGVVESEAARFRRASGLDGEHFRVSVAGGLPHVTHDPDAFTDVITNLLSNAYKYTPAANRRIQMTVGFDDGRVVLAVEDNGPGISPRERRKIFDQFYRAGDLLSREIEGSGLGLSIARNIVRAHGGRILVEDSALGGSRFLVILPASRRAARAPVGSTS